MIRSFCMLSVLIINLWSKKEVRKCKKAFHSFRFPSFRFSGHKIDIHELSLFPLYSKCTIFYGFFRKCVECCVVWLFLPLPTAKRIGNHQKVIFVISLYFWLHRYIHENNRPLIHKAHLKIYIYVKLKMKIQVLEKVVKGFEHKLSILPNCGLNITIPLSINQHCHLTLMSCVHF
jgi:hypothetical protein